MKKKTTLPSWVMVVIYLSIAFGALLLTQTFMDSILIHLLLFVLATAMFCVFFMVGTVLVTSALSQLGLLPPVSEEHYQAFVREMRKDLSKFQQPLNHFSHRHDPPGGWISAVMQRVSQEEKETPPDEIKQ